MQLRDGARKTLADLGQQLRHQGSRQGPIAGMTPPPKAVWMRQVARHVTMAAWGFRSPGQSLIHDRDGTYCPALQQLIAVAGVTRMPRPPRSPPLTAVAERWVRSVKEECLARMIRCGEASLRHALTHSGEHLHHERHHQGKRNVLPFPAVSQDRERAGPRQDRERCGGS
jgi:hypothetical protein